MSEFAKDTTCNACGRDAVAVFATDGLLVDVYHPAEVLRDAMDKGEERCPVLIPMACPCEHYSSRIPFEEIDLVRYEEEQ